MTAGAYPGFCSIPPGWDASPSQVTPQHFTGTHLYSLGGERH